MQKSVLRYVPRMMKWSRYQDEVFNTPYIYIIVSWSVSCDKEDLIKVSKVPSCIRKVWSS